MATRGFIVSLSPFVRILFHSHITMVHSFCCCCCWCCWGLYHTQRLIYPHIEREREKESCFPTILLWELHIPVRKMTDQSSEDWLPTGWTVEVKVRRSGKKDKVKKRKKFEHKFDSFLDFYCLYLWYCTYSQMGVIDLLYKLQFLTVYTGFCFIWLIWKVVIFVLLDIVVFRWCYFCEYVKYELLLIL